MVESGPMEDVPRELQARVAAFEDAVSRHFGFLVGEHGFEQKHPRTQALDAPKDSTVSISFSRRDLRVTIALGLHDPALGITLRDNDWADKPAPATGRRVKSVHLEYLIEFLTDGGVSPLLPHDGDGPARAVHASRRRVEDDLDGVLAQLAARVVAHAPRILAGDVAAVFEDAEAFYQRKLRC